jgi:hypothetical protein
MRLGGNVSSGEANTSSTKLHGAVHWLSLIVIGTLCLTNYLAIYNDTFRTLLGGKSPMMTASMPESEKHSAGELAQIALLLGVGAADAAGNVKYLLEKGQKTVAENALLQQKLGTAEKLHQDLAIKHRELETQHLHLEKSKAEMEVRTKAAAKKLSESVASRATRGVARHVGGAAGESIPVVGVGVVAAMLALDVVDACDLIKEVNEMNRSVGVEVEDEQRVCGVKVPDQRQLAADVSKNWQAAYLAAANVVGKPPAIPQVSWNDLKGQVCAVTAVPLVCP